MAPTGRQHDGVGLDGRCGLAAVFGRADSGDPRWHRTIDGTTVHFHSRAVRLTSYLVTGRIRRLLHEERLTSDGPRG
ncbi:hypothetical protein [Nocardioides coralli]|uniref:hypothetical protein n=1 Tax=Nocardioides coralli TaxID=2872154 RepID=UPI001CA40E4F|nr:hypothetical protein [Nocardioides coralli]QZY29434.1 hypothetical protein K6T13_01630 [Nocardioides coralli]